MGRESKPRSERAGTTTDSTDGPERRGGRWSGVGKARGCLGILMECRIINYLHYLTHLRMLKAQRTKSLTELLSLMIEYNVGFSVEKKYEEKKLDSDYFPED
jgi:hypothetical protein